ncbi:MAG: hypothetical protein HUU37_03130 [Bdellovibrionales bacterium]|nr:hypothetical protein [Bdellovibrionales bacterium]
MFKRIILMWLVAVPAFAQWDVGTEFVLRLSEGLFDRVVEDFWKRLQEKQIVDIGSFTISPADIPIQISGVRAELQYSFEKPARTDPGQRAWSLETRDFGATITVASMSASQTIIREIDGVLVRIRIEAECRNMVLRLPRGSASVRADVTAGVEQGHIRLQMPRFEADWRQGAWTLESVSCSGTQGLEQFVATETLRALGSFQNFDREVRGALEKKFADWSRDMSAILLSESTLPGSTEELRVRYIPREVVETAGGVALRGRMEFQYPYVSRWQDIRQEFELPRGASLTENGSGLLLPMKAIKALMMGQYFAGKLTYGLRSYEIPAFHALMQSRWQQFFAWPDLMRFPKNTTFLFQFLPMGPPSFENEAATADGVIAGDLMVPIAAWMFAPDAGLYVPYVEFLANLTGRAELAVAPGGKAVFRLATSGVDLRHRWSRKYVEKHAPQEGIAVGKMGEALKDSLNTEGWELPVPSLPLGPTMKLVPEKWNLRDGVVELRFTTSG